MMLFDEQVLRVYDKVNHTDLQPETVDVNYGLFSITGGPKTYIIFIRCLIRFNNFIQFHFCILRSVMEMGIKEPEVRLPLSSQ